MLELTLTNGSTTLLNPDVIVSVQACPHTVVKLTTGDKLLVAQSLAEVGERFMAYKQRIHTQLTYPDSESQVE
jgi:flagellar protein FlbD